MEETWKDKPIVAAIDFGTTYSGFAISFRKDYENKKTKMYTKKWHADSNLVTEKTPTILLLTKDGSFDSFGFDAESKYAELAVENNEQQWRCFRRFKMELYKDATKRGIHTKSTIRDTQNREFSAITVFSLSIKFMKDQIVAVVGSKFHLKEDSIWYVLTVPAIWSDNAKDFMRKAAIRADILEERLKIALEPECAAIYVQESYLPDLASVPETNITMAPGTRHLVVDLGGGTCDIAAHKVTEKNKFEELIPPDGGPWGADNINLKFEGFLVSISGGEALESFKKNHVEDFLELQREFEQKKRAFEVAGNDKWITIKLPSTFQKLHKRTNSEDLARSVQQMEISEDIKFTSDKMRLKYKIFSEFFSETIGKVIEIVERVLNKVPEDIPTLIFVGGFSDCNLLQNEISRKWVDKTILFPQDAVLAVMMGAVLFGRDESIVSARISRFTFGLDWNEDFVKGEHPEEKREETEDGYVCNDVFKKIITKGQLIPWDSQILVLEAYPKSRFQSEMQFPFYRSEISDSPKFVTDPGCYHMGTMTVPLKCDPRHVLDQSVKLKVFGGKTEIRAKAEDGIGNKYYMSFFDGETQV